MNIAFLLRLWPVYGGGETVTISLANEMVKRGHSITIFYFKDSNAGGAGYIN
ncbi:glycosyltransferase family 4 protein, partial [Bacteroides xylanisolvens]